MPSEPILPRASDERLLELIAAGEEQAFEIVVRRYRSSLVGYCRRLGLSESRAEDAVQQCFLSALLALRRGDQVRDLRAWLGRIAHNVAVNMMRSGTASRETGLIDDRSGEERAIHIPDLDGGLAAREALAEVAALPPMQREALLQSALGGRSYGEVAVSMGVSEGAVRGLLHRARSTLRAAAATFSPFPLVRRVSGWLGGGGPSTGRAIEMATPGGSTALSSTAARAVGAGLTAIIVAAGVAVAPRGATHRPAHELAHALAQVRSRARLPTIAATGEAIVNPRTSTTHAAGHASRRSSAAAGGVPTATVGTPTAVTLKPSTGGPSHHGGSTHTTPSPGSQGQAVTPAVGPAQASSVSPSSPVSAAPTQEAVNPSSPPPGEEPVKGEEKEHETEESSSGDGETHDGSGGGSDDGSQEAEEKAKSPGAGREGKDN